MKKFIIMAVMAVVAISANAQVYVGGGLGFKFVKSSSDSETAKSYTFLPEIGYKLNEKVDLGTEIGYTGVYADGETYGAFTVAPYVRYTVASIDKVSFFIEGGFGLQSWNHDLGTQYEVGLKPAIKIQATDKVSFIAKIGFLGYQCADDDATESLGIPHSQFGFNLDGNALQFGINYEF